MPQSREGGPKLSVRARFRCIEQRATEVYIQRPARPIIVKQEEEMKHALYWLPVLASSAISLALQGASIRARGDVVELGGLKFRVPADWMEEKPDDAHCFKQYRLEPVDDDKEDAQVIIRFLGKAKRGGAAAYVKRWKGMFLPPEGQTMHEAAKFRQLTVNGAAVTYVDIRGDYKGIRGDDTTPREDFRLLGVYLNTPKGSYIIRLFGPADTVAFYRKQFEDWVKAFK
jgi:hypothetical protein